MIEGSGPRSAMPKESLIFGAAGVFFGILVGWILGSQQAPAPAPAGTAQSAPAPSAQSQTAPPIDESRVASLRAAAQQNPGDADTRVQLGNLYFDAERFDEAARWYEDALKVDPKNVNASTDLGISYYYAGQTDRALKQFEHSLSIDPRHTKTMLNQGIVLAFGKQDLAGAEAKWKQVIELAPDSPEAQAARRGLEGIKAAGHPGAGTTPGS